MATFEDVAPVNLAHILHLSTGDADPTGLVSRRFYLASTLPCAGATSFNLKNFG